MANDDMIAVHSSIFDHLRRGLFTQEQFGVFMYMFSYADDRTGTLTTSIPSLCARFRNGKVPVSKMQGIVDTLEKGGYIKIQHLSPTSFRVTILRFRRDTPDVIGEVPIH